MGELLRVYINAYTSQELRDFYRSTIIEFLFGKRKMSALPLHHFRHLKRLADLRRCNISEALDFLMRNVAPKEDDWLTPRWGKTTETRDVDLKGHKRDDVLKAIQGLHHDIRPVTDGPYLTNLEFFSGANDLVGIEAEGMRILDFPTVEQREQEVFKLVNDLLPAMSIEQFRAYHYFNSQFLRPVREPTKFTMPRIEAPAIDAGAYVGYKALALAQSTGGSPVLAFEIDWENIEVLKLNIANNPKFPVEAIHAGLSDTSAEMPINTRSRRTMAHSLTSFDELHEKNQSLLAGGYRNTETETVDTVRLDDFTKDFARLSAVHISVNGHELQVVRGGIETAKKSDILRVSCPYIFKGKPVRELVIQAFHDNGVTVHGISGAAVIAGSALGEYHAVPV